MMKRLFILSGILVIWGFVCSAQSKDVHISYSLNISDSFKEKSDLSLLTQILSTEDKSDFIDLWVNDRYIRVEDKSVQHLIELQDLQTKRSFLLSPSTSTYEEITQQKNSIKTLSEAGNVNIYDHANYRIIYQDRIKKNILGYNCQKAIIHLPQKETADGSPILDKIEVWYSKDLPQVYWSKFMYLKDIPGAALQISTDGIGISAQEIRIEKPNTLDFEIPASYQKIVSEDDFDEEYQNSPMNLGEGRMSYYDSNLQLFGIQDEKGNRITTARYAEIHGFKNQLAIVADAHLNYGLINVQGQEIQPCSFDDLIQSRNGYFIFEKNNKQGYLNAQGEEIIAPTFSIASDFKGEFAIVNNQDCFGIIDSIGNIIVPIRYDMITNFQDSLAIVVTNEKYGLINLQGEELIQPKYDYLQFGNSKLILAKEHGKYGFINAEGLVVIPFIYEHAQAFHKERAKVSTLQKGSFYIDKNGREL